ncbi:MAG: tRNA (adenosine(37)-N6)-threonylcarbamoyltransferase complex dimerization subunit type 1 TsaB [Planctomycetes bacterium]|nr:tRNA (adenosine(37)-N6)-threonylcarbamoyltransferase complex dimerization subunit type 1 TsaB [Planctomycetota bacterium]
MIAGEVNLFIECGLEPGGVAVAIDEVPRFGLVQSFKAHLEEVPPLIDGLLRDGGMAPKDVSRIFVSIGPGAYTGLRVSVALAKSMAIVTGATIHPVSTLMILANAAMRAGNARGRIVIMRDAKMAQGFIGSYFVAEDGIISTLDVDCCVDIQKLGLIASAQSRETFAIVDGLAEIESDLRVRGLTILETPRYEDVLASFCNLATTVEFPAVDPKNLHPAYLRDPITKYRAGG